MEQESQQMAKIYDAVRRFCEKYNLAFDPIKGVPSEDSLIQEHPQLEQMKAEVIRRCDRMPIYHLCTLCLCGVITLDELLYYCPSNLIERLKMLFMEYKGFSLTDEELYNCLTNNILCFSRYKSPYDYIDSLPTTEIRLAVAANLYSYIKKNKLLTWGISENYLLNFDVKHCFGRYGTSASDFYKLLLPCTHEILPDLSAWVYLLEYYKNCYPCMPDMEWWKEKGKIEVAKKVIVATKEFIERYPNSIFKGDAEGIIENEMPPLRQKLIADMKESPEDYGSSIVMCLLGKRKIVFDRFVDLDTCRICEFFLRNNLSISIGELIRNEVIMPYEEKNLYRNNTYRELISIPDRNKSGIDFWITGFDGSGKTSVANSLHYLLFKHHIFPIEKEQTEEIKNFFADVFETILYQVPPRPTNPHQLPTSIQYAINKWKAPVNIIDVGYSSPLSKYIAHLDLFPYEWSTTMLPQGMNNCHKKIICITIDASLFGKGNPVDYRRGLDNVTYLEMLLDLYEITPLYGSRNKMIANNIIGLIVVFTKTDKGRIDDERVDEIICRCRDFCEKWGICKENEYKPYILHYSTGNNLIGGLFRYDFSDALQLYRLIEKKLPPNPWWKLCSNIVSHNQSNQTSDDLFESIKSDFNLLFE